MRSRISIRGCVHPSVRPSVRRSVRHTQVEYPRNGPNLNKIASGIRKYAIWKTIQRQVRGQLARTHLLSELCSTCFSCFPLFSFYYSSAVPVFFFFHSRSFPFIYSALFQLISFQFPPLALLPFCRRGRRLLTLAWPSAPLWWKECDRP